MPEVPEPDINCRVPRQCNYQQSGLEFRVEGLGFGAIPEMPEPDINCRVPRQCNYQQSGLEFRVEGLGLWSNTRSAKNCHQVQDAAETY